MASPAAHSPESPHGADGHELDDGLDSLRRLVVGQGWPWVLVWLVSRGWMVSQWAQHYRYIANDVNYYFGQLRQPGGQANTLREYPLPVVWLLDLLRKPVAGDPNLYLVLFACSMALLDAAFSIWLWRRHSRVASIYWMAYVFAMGPLVWFRYDLLAGVIVGMAAFLVAKDSRASGALVALGAAMKLWPALLVVALVGRTRDARRSLQAFLVTGASLALLSLLAAGPTRLFSPSPGRATAVCRSRACGPACPCGTTTTTSGSTRRRCTASTCRPSTPMRSMAPMSTCSWPWPA